MTFLSVFLLSFSTSLFAQKASNSVKKYIYLTFDDGPLNGSENIDEVFKNEKLKVTVFLVGEHVEKNKTQSIKDIVGYTAQRTAFNNKENPNTNKNSCSPFT